MSQVITHLGQAVASESSRWGGSPGPLVVTALVRSDWAATLQVLLARTAHAALWSRTSGPRRIEGRASAGGGPLQQNQACHRPRATPTKMCNRQRLIHNPASGMCHQFISLDSSGCTLHSYAPLGHTSPRPLRLGVRAAGSFDGAPPQEKADHFNELHNSGGTLHPLRPLGRTSPRPLRLGVRAAGSFRLRIPEAGCYPAGPPRHADGASAGSVCLILRGCPHCRRPSRVRFAGDAPPLTAAGNAAPAPSAARACFAAPMQVRGRERKMSFRPQSVDLPTAGAMSVCQWTYMRMWQEGGRRATPRIFCIWPLDKNAVIEGGRKPRGAGGLTRPGPAGGPG